MGCSKDYRRQNENNATSLRCEPGPPGFRLSDESPLYLFEAQNPWFQATRVGLHLFETTSVPVSSHVWPRSHLFGHLQETKQAVGNQPQDLSNRLLQRFREPKNVSPVQRSGIDLPRREQYTVRLGVSWLSTRSGVHFDGAVSIVRYLNIQGEPGSQTCRRNRHIFR